LCIDCDVDGHVPFQLAGVESLSVLLQRLRPATDKDMPLLVATCGTFDNSGFYNNRNCILPCKYVSYRQLTLFLVFLTARGKKKKIKQLLPLLALAKLKITALIPLFLGIIAFAAAKALLLAKVSLLVAGIIALKKLLASKHHETSYEVVAHPHHDEHFAGGGHGWGRSIDDAQNLAYAGHIKSD
jgi:hypothetical protein